ncbi:hypothetical protein MTR_5g009450 [Medicago truncatula]|uniref:Uncharacterized protein n=1 Tax=Medicago truncatula TaxID=3880 RepID=G7KAM0_MEDTR|nr:hypothetical protein MTR_5g009450 [Medicago truncatula]
MLTQTCHMDISSDMALGGGLRLRQDHDAISVMKAGRLRFSSKPNKYWVGSGQYYCFNSILFYNICFSTI